MYDEYEEQKFLALWKIVLILRLKYSWLQFSKLQEKVETAESRVSVLETMIDDLQWNIDKIRREQRLNRHLADVLERVSTIWEMGVVFNGIFPSVLCCEKLESLVYNLWLWMGCCNIFLAFNQAFMKFVAFLQVNSKGYKVYGAGSSLYGGTITINARKVRSGPWFCSRETIYSRRACV